MDKQTEQDIRIEARDWCGEIDTDKGCSENQAENIALHFFEKGRGNDKSFIQHIQNHLDKKESGLQAHKIPPGKVGCVICGKSADEIRGKK